MWAVQAPCRCLSVCGRCRCSGVCEWWSSTPNRILRMMLHAPVPPTAEIHERLVDCEQSSEHAQRASAANLRKPREGRRLRTEQNSEDAPRAIAAARPKRGSSITSRILSMLHTPAPPPATSHERVVAYEQILADAPRKNVRATLRRVEIRTVPQERFDTHDPRRRLADELEDSHCATTRAIRHAQSPQRVGKRALKFARCHSESDATRTIPSEGSGPLRRARNPQRVRPDDSR